MEKKRRQREAIAECPTGLRRGRLRLRSKRIRGTEVELPQSLLEAMGSLLEEAVAGG